MQPIPPFRLTLTRLALLGALSLLASCQTFTDGDQQLYDQSNRLLDESLAARYQVEEISEASLDPDFARNQKIHRAWRISLRG